LEWQLVESQGEKRTLELIFRAYDDGVAFRYHLPKQPKLAKFNITEELTTFEFTADHTTWWVESLPDTYERDYNETGLSQAAERGASTPVTLKTVKGTHVSLHEANLTDWAGMKLKRGEGGSEFSLQADLVPWFESDIRVKGETPHSSPWRTIQLADDAGGLITSFLILNLNPLQPAPHCVLGAAGGFHYPRHQLSVPQDLFLGKVQGDVFVHELGLPRTIDDDPQL
jgi:alpha-glucosidase